MVQCLLFTNSSTLALSKMNANTESYMRISFRNLTTFISLMVKRTSNSYSVVGRFGNRILPFSQHRENCGLLLFDFANRFLIHIFVLQNPQIVSISTQSHRAGVDVSSSPNNYNGSVDFVRCMARRFLCRRLRCSRADSNMF